MVFPCMLLPYENIIELFADATDEKANNRFDRNEIRITRNSQGEKEEVLGNWGKYQRHQNPFSVNFFQTFRSAKLGLLMLGMPVSTIFSEDEWSMASPGQVFYRQTREAYEVMDETLCTHTISRKAQEFVKETNDQDPYFGAKPLADVLIRTSNEVRHLGQFLAFDEEIIAQLGKLPGVSYCPDKKNKRW